MRRRDVLFTLVGSPHESDAISTALAVCSALLDRGAEVAVWACGNATLLSQTSLEVDKPRDIFAGDRTYPTTAAYIDTLVSKHGPAIEWSVCHFCSNDRGATQHIDVVRLRPAMFYPRFVAAAAKTITIGRL